LLPENLKKGDSFKNEAVKNIRRGGCFLGEYF